MAVTENTYTGDGSTVLFSFTFPYLDQSHVKVSLNGSDTTAFTFANATTVQLNSAPAVGVAVRVYRNSDEDNVEATFFPGSAIRATDLNENFLQSLYLNQETRRIAQDATTGTIADGSISSAKLGSEVVTEPKIGTAAVTEAKIGTGAVTETKLGAGAVTNSKIAAGAVQATQLATDAVTNPKIATGAVNTDELANSSVTQDKIGTNVLTPRVSEINGGPLAGFRNAIINGNFNVWQRGTSFSNPASGAYLADRWLHGFDGSGSTRTISRQDFTLGQTDVPGEPLYFLRYAQSVAGSGGTLSNLQQRIEGVRSFAGQQLTVSFYAKAAASTTLPSITLIQGFGTGGSPSANVTTTLAPSVVIGTGWARYTYTATLSSISGKTLGSAGDDRLSLIFNLPLNSTFTLDFAQVQVEAGPVATPFERRPIGTELALCERYYKAGSAVRTADTQALIYFSTSMRAAPIVSVTTLFGSTVSVTGGSYTSFDGFRATVASGGGDFTWTASAEL